MNKGELIKQIFDTPIVYRPGQTFRDTPEFRDAVFRALDAYNPAAAFILGGLLVQETSVASAERGRALLRETVCAGYPLALQVLEQQKITRDQFGCTPPADTDFTGSGSPTWRGSRSNRLVPAPHN